MKLLLTFFLFICFELLGAQVSVATCIHDLNAHHSSGFHLAKTKAVESKHIFLTHHTDVPGDDELPLFVEEDDEENNNRKCKSSIESFPTDCYTYLTSYPCRDLINSLSVRRYLYHISCSKYIAQRVLRI